MAHYSVLDENNIVVQVFVGKNENDFVPGITDWEEYYAPEGFTVKRTSYNTHGGEHLLGGTPFRKNYAGIGFSYDPERDAFIPPQPFDSWVLNEQTCLWEAPIPYPEDGGAYDWNEENQSWDLVVDES